MELYGGYCERVEPGWFTEPLNTVAALAFVWAAIQLWRHLGRGARTARRELQILMLLAGGIGLAAALGHAAGQTPGFVLALLCFTAFVLVYWNAFLRRVLRLSGWRWGIAAVASLALAGALLLRLPLHAFGGALIYSPVLLMILAGILTTVRVDRRLMRDLFIAGALLSLALGFRALDRVLCDWAVVGTQWLWYLLAAGTVYVLVDGLGRHLQKRLEQDA